MKVSAVVISHGHAGELEQSLPALAPQVDELVVIANIPGSAGDGLGRPSQRRHDEPAWTQFRCIQPTFPSGSVAGPDLVFVVQSVPPRDLVVTRRHFTSY